MTLATRLLSGDILHMRATVTHGRRGAIRHTLRCGVDFLLFAPETMRPPKLMSKNKFNLISYHETDHGGPRGRGEGASWAWSKLEQARIPRRQGMVLALLAQPRFLWSWFNPVSFWMVIEGDKLIAVIAEVNNTFGQRHSYLCQNEDFAPIERDSKLRSEKVFHVSPFQEIRGHYKFNFSLSPARMAIRIRQIDADEGLEAGMAGSFEPVTSAGLVGACLRRPGGPLRVLALIHWHALRLKLKGAVYRRLPAPPEQEIT